MENVAGEQDLALQQHFPYKTSNFFENSNCRISLLFNSKGHKLEHFGIFDALFPFLAFFKVPMNRNFLSSYLKELSK